MEKIFCTCNFGAVTWNLYDRFSAPGSRVEAQLQEVCIIDVLAVQSRG